MKLALISVCDLTNPVLNDRGNKTYAPHCTPYVVQLDIHYYIELYHDYRSQISVLQRQKILLFSS